MPVYSSAADSVNLYKWQPMGKRPHCHWFSCQFLKERNPVPSPKLRCSYSAETKRGKTSSKKNYLKHHRHGKE